MSRTAASQPETSGRAATAARLAVAPVSSFPSRLAVGRGQAFFVDGTCSHPSGRIQSLELRLGDRPQPVIASGMPRPDDTLDSDYWWAIVTVPPTEEPRTEWIELVATLEDGSRETARLGSIDLVPRLENPIGASNNGRFASLAEQIGKPGSGEPLVAICMATYNPPIELFRRQIDSIRGQTHGNWICLISDDNSSPEKLEQMREVLGDDRRLLLSVAERQGGFYRNFERALSMVPPGVDFVALSDQDDRWHPDKLSSQLQGLQPGNRLVYSDMRIVDEEGAVLSDTYWSFRRNNHTDFGALVMANTVTGAALLFDASLLDDVLPFPPEFENCFHDHWIAQVAMALGGISYIDRPLYDYVQHGNAALGHFAANAFGRYDRSVLERLLSRAASFRPQSLHPGWRWPYFKLYCRIAVNVAILQLRCGDRMTEAKQRTLDRMSDSPRGVAWLTVRATRSLSRRSATLGRERVMLAGLAWRRYARLRRRARQLRGRVGAAMPHRSVRRKPAVWSGSVGGEGDAEWLTPILVDYFTRDGSTLMMRLLGSSPQIAVEMSYPYERKYFAYLWRWSQLLDREDWPDQLWGPQGLGSLTQLRSSAMMGPPPWRPRPLIRSLPDEPSMAQRTFELAWREFSQRATRAHRSEIGSASADAGPVRYYAEKHLNTWKVPLAQLPPLKVIVLLRDPRDSWISINAFNDVRGGGGLGRDRAGSREEHLDNVIRRQRERLRWIAELQEKSDIPVVRYEDMVRDLPGTAARLGEWLEVEIDAEPAARDKDTRLKHMTASTPEQSIGRWREEMEPEVAEKFSRELGPELRALDIDA
jgi:glycosyltransferase involved in cell wall biosynthesis